MKSQAVVPSVASGLLIAGIATIAVLMSHGTGSASSPAGDDVSVSVEAPTPSPSPVVKVAVVKPHVAAVPADNGQASDPTVDETPTTDATTDSGTSVLTEKTGVPDTSEPGITRPPAPATMIVHPSPTDASVPPPVVVPSHS